MHLQPGHKMLLEDKERERVIIKEKREQRERMKASAEDWKTDGGASTSNVHDATCESQSLVSSHALLTSVQCSANVVDGDSSKTLLQLMKLGRCKESTIELAMQCIELDEWEEGIDWQGLVGSDNNNEEDGTILKVCNAVKGGLNEPCHVVGKDCTT